MSPYLVYLCAMGDIYRHTVCIYAMGNICQHTLCISVCYGRHMSPYLVYLSAMGDICHHTLCISVLWVTYIAIPCVSMLWVTYDVIPCVSLCAMGDICHHTLCYLCVLWVTYVAIPCVSLCAICDHSLCICVLWVTYVTIPCVSLCAIADICHRSFISLNFAGLFSIAARISIQLSMTSHGENEVLNAATFNMFTRHFVDLEQCFCSKTDQFTCNLETNMINHASEMKLHTILSTL